VSKAPDVEKKLLDKIKELEEQVEYQRVLNEKLQTSFDMRLESAIADERKNLHVREADLARRTHELSLEDAEKSKELAEKMQGIMADIKDSSPRLSIMIDGVDLVAKYPFIGEFWKKGTETCNLTHNGVKTIVDFQTMEVSQALGLRWQVEIYGDYSDMTEESSSILEKAYQYFKSDVLHKRTQKLEYNNNEYLVDFRTMEQQNVEFKTTRKIKRIEGGMKTHKIEVLKERNFDIQIAQRVEGLLVECILTAKMASIHPFEEELIKYLCLQPLVGSRRKLFERKVSSIKRMQNDLPRQIFEIERNSLQDDYDIVSGFHGSRNPDALEESCKFDPFRASNGYLGKGFYISNNPQYSLDHYTSDDSIFLCIGLVNRHTHKEHHAPIHANEDGIETTQLTIDGTKMTAFTDPNRLLLAYRITFE
jgi:hypothetical protein